MSVTNSERLPNIVSIVVGTQAATITLPAMYARKRLRIKEVRYIDQLGVAADNTNYLQLSLQDGAGNVYASLDTRAANNGALTANTSKKCTLGGSGVTVLGDSTNPEVDVAAGTDLLLVVTKNGTGVPTKGILQVECYPL